MARQYINSNKERMPELSMVQNETRKARALLRQHSSYFGADLYTHLTELLSLILTERPKDVVDNFEMYSYRVKRCRMIRKMNFPKIYDPSVNYEYAVKMTKFLQNLQVKKDELDEVEENNVKNEVIGSFISNFSTLIDFLDKGDRVNLAKSEITLLKLSIIKFIKENAVNDVRFWGKVFGRIKNYYILEVKLSDEEISNRLKRSASIKSATMIETTESESNNSSTENNEHDFHNENKIVIAEDPIGVGLNDKIYYVCNSPELDEWTELPLVTAEHITVARQIVWSFTGCLTNKIKTYPKFLGNEGNYLRAQIARITAATRVAPVDYFELVNDTGELNGIKVQLNPNYKPLSARKYQLLYNWCHYSPYITQQGRIAQWGSQKREQGSDGEISESDDRGRIVNQEEKNLLQLELLSNDRIKDGMPVWSTRLSSDVDIHSAIAVLWSNVWPGSFSFTSNHNIGNIYIGEGYKYNTRNFQPRLIFPVQDQYKLGPEIVEVQDPIVRTEESSSVDEIEDNAEGVNDSEDEEHSSDEEN